MNYLLQNGIRKRDIVRADSIHAPEMLYRISDRLFEKTKLDVMSIQKDKCMIDLSGGMVLGGVERWSYSLANILKKIEIKGCYLVPSYIQNTVKDETLPVIFIELDKRTSENYFLDACVKTLVDTRAKTIICNFPFKIFIAACIIKKQFLPNLHIIAVVHNDEDIYYRTYCIWQEYIDECLIISKKMKHILIDRGFPAKKIKKLYWKIPYKKVFNRNYSSSDTPIRIGYAGRLKKTQKRLDLVIDVAEKLKARGIYYILELAGIGDYEDILKKEIASRNLEEYIILRGLIAHKDILQFWKSQDIYLSCSDWEGHSISQSEAMVAGAVPIVTNTSGAEDDIKDGYNGYIVDLQDVDMIVQKIEYLYEHRQYLPIMGKRSQNIIIRRNELINEEVFWKNLLVYN